MVYEDIDILLDLVHRENNGLTPKENEALRSVIDYADGEYVNHCEEIGRIAIEDIERMKQEWVDETCDVFHDWLVNSNPELYLGNAQMTKNTISDFKKLLVEKL